MSWDVEVAIPTLFRPMTLEPLLEALERQGVSRVDVIEGKPVNPAWNGALERAKSRYLLLLNDDIEICPTFVAEMMFVMELGHTWAGGNRVERFTGSSRSVSWPDRPEHRGEAFCLDMAVEVPLIPRDFQIYHGDDWLFFHHKRTGRFGVADSAEYKSPTTATTADDPRMQEWLSQWYGGEMTMDERCRLDHEAVRQHFLVADGLRANMAAQGIDARLLQKDADRSYRLVPVDLR